VPLGYRGTTLTCRIRARAGRDAEGYETDRARATFACFPRSLQVLGRREMSEILEYAVSRYRRNFVGLYE
jgi:hypothetical protein